MNKFHHFVLFALIAILSACGGHTEEGTDLASSNNELRSCSWQDIDLSNIMVANEPMRFVAGVWGSSQDNVYATVSSAKAGAILHFDGQSWTQEVLPLQPMLTLRINGRSDGTQIMASVLNAAAQTVLVKYEAGVWSEMKNSPSASAIMDIVYIGDDAYAVGQDMTGANAAWFLDGDEWIKITLPNLSDTYQLYRGYGTNEGAVFVGNRLNVDNEPIGGVMLYLDGATWYPLDVPADCVSIGDVHGSSLDDVYTTCMTQTLESNIYHVANRSQWTSTLVDGAHVPVWSFGSNSVVTVGFSQVSQENVNTLPEVSLFSTVITSEGTQTSPFDSDGQLPVELWFDASGHTGYLATFRQLYRGACR